jgi:hypothetical protein
MLEGFGAPPPLGLGVMDRIELGMRGVAREGQHVAGIQIVGLAGNDGLDQAFVFAGFR